MSLAGYLLAAVGALLFAVGYARARDPWRRYRALRAQADNASRYRAWRGGPASAADEKTGASVAMQLLRRRARTWASVAIVGVGLVVAGFMIALG